MVKLSYSKIGPSLFITVQLNKTKKSLKIKCSKTPKRVSVIGFLLPKNFIDKESLV